MLICVDFCHTFLSFVWHVHAEVMLLLMIVLTFGWESSISMDSAEFQVTVVPRTQYFCVNTNTQSAPFFLNTTGIGSTVWIETNPVNPLAPAGTNWTYANSQSCSWYFTAPLGYKPQITVTAFATEKSYDTVYFYPSVSTGAALPAPLSSGTFTGGSFTVRSTTRFLLVTFSSDSSVVAAGVHAFVQAVV
jgi:hypothetical protein